MRITIGPLRDLRQAGWLTGKVGSTPVCVFWHEGRPCAVDDRCPHMGFPLHRGTVENGLLTCHWHHARFDLVSGGTLDPWADDVRAYRVEICGEDVVVVADPDGDAVAHLRERLVEGLEQGLALVTAKAVLALLDAGVDPAEVVRLGVEFGTANRREGWGSGLTVLTAMAHLLPHLDPADRPLALVHGLTFLSGDTRGHAPWFPLAPLPSTDVPLERVTSWYRRFVDTRSSDAAERAVATAVAADRDGSEVVRMLVAAATDHVFLDGGHTLDFTNKAVEALDHLGWDRAPRVLPTLAAQTAQARRSEEQGAWRHPHDLTDLIAAATSRLPELVAQGATATAPFDAVAELGWSMLADDPHEVVGVTCDAVAAGATPEQLGRALALAAGVRITRFHVQNDHGDWDAVHHGFTTANALHQLLVRAPSTDALRGVLHGAMKVYLDRFLNVPPARLPWEIELDGPAVLTDLEPCWAEAGQVDRAGAIVHRWLVDGGDVRSATAALGHGLLSEDAGFHWYQVVEAAVRQLHAWPPGAEEGRLLLAGAARFLAAHTPTRRELPQVVRIATRLRRGDPLYEEA